MPPRYCKTKPVTPIALSYPGKRTREEILTGPAASFCEIRANTAATSRIMWSENLAALIALTKNPEVCGKVRLVYIDPPYSTQASYRDKQGTLAYEDRLAGSEFVEFLRERLIALRELLAEDGSLYLHLDEKMVFEMKLVLDEVFGPKAFKNCIVRKKCNPKNSTSRSFGKVVDYILFYTKTDKYVWNKQHETWTEERAKEYRYIEEGTGRRFMKVPVHASGVRNGETGQPWRGRMPPAGKHWQYPPKTLDEMDARGEIYWSSSGNPRRKIYLDESQGVSVQDLWTDFKDANNQNIQTTGYPTEKNLSLLSRIVAASSNPGDLVLDAFMGSGTTLAAAQGLGRRWIGIDQSRLAVETAVGRMATGAKSGLGFAVFVEENKADDAAGIAALLQSNNYPDPS